MARAEKIKVLIADDDGQLSRRLADYLAEHGFETRIATNGTDARSLVLDWKPKIVMADLMLPECNALGIMDFIKSEHRLRHQFIHLIVMSGHNDEFNVKQAFRRGAKDYLVKPFKYEDALRRLVFHCRSYRSLNELSQKDFSKVDEASLMLHLTDLVLRQAISKQSPQDILFNLTRMVSMKMDGVRCSIVNVLDQQTGIVVTSNDDQKASGIALDLNKYPEVLNVANTGSLLAIENLELSPQMKTIKSLLKNVMFNSLIVCPVYQKDKIFGVLSLRMPPEKERISDNEIRFVEIVSHVVSLVISGEKFKESGDFWHREDLPLPIAFPMRPGKK